ncbi:hypothetical protein LCGC14_1403050 [marine sediment metagenome]|uniref:Uncharacterized protein n=1 Tax=marine sediment metagenome TaxID=412755 RepID=A0A0F9MBW3_9ZZZZ
MTKDTFTAALKHAQEVQGAYQIKPSRRDALYDELASEGDADVLDALKRLGRSDKTINYFNIKAFIDESRAAREWGNRNKQKPEPPMEGSPAPEYEDMPPEVQKTIDSFRDKWKW